MNKFLRDHPETLLIILAVFFLAFVVGFYLWGMNDIVTTVNKALNYVPQQQDTGFDLQSAAKLDWRGLVK